MWLIMGSVYQGSVHRRVMYITRLCPKVSSERLRTNLAKSSLALLFVMSVTIQQDWNSKILRNSYAADIVNTTVLAGLDH